MADEDLRRPMRRPGRTRIAKDRDQRESAFVANRDIFGEAVVIRRDSHRAFRKQCTERALVLSRDTTNSCGCLIFGDSDKKGAATKTAGRCPLAQKVEKPQDLGGRTGLAFIEIGLNRGNTAQVTGGQIRLDQLFLALEVPVQCCLGNSCFGYDSIDTDGLTAFGIEEPFGHSEDMITHRLPQDRLVCPVSRSPIPSRPMGNSYRSFSIGLGPAQDRGPTA